MSRSPRRLLAAIATAATLGAAGIAGLAATAAPAAAASTPSNCALMDLTCLLGGGSGGTGGTGTGGTGDGLIGGLPVDPCTLVPSLPTCGGSGGGTPAACTGTEVPILGICLPIADLPVGGVPTDPSAVCSLVLTTLMLPSAESTALCAALGAGAGGGLPALPTGVSSAVPNTFPDNATAQMVFNTDPFEQLSRAAGGATVTLTGPATIASTGDPVLDDSTGTITATFDLADPTPATPGSYTLNIAPKDPTGLTTVLASLGLPALSVDTVPVTVTEATGPAPVTGLTATPITSKTASLAWTAPTAATPAVTGYSIIVSKTTTATATDSGVTVTQSGTTPSASVAGLTPGTKYYVTVTPKSASGNGTAANTTMLTPNDTSLTLDLTPANVVGVESVTAGGSLDKVTANGKSGLANKKVGIYVRYTGIAKGQLLKSVTTDATGEYAYSFTPKRGGVYAAVFLGDKGTSTTPGDSLAVSDAVNQTVTPTLTFSASGKAHGKHFTLKAKGKVSPAESGKKVIVYRTIKGAAQKLGAAHVTGSGAYKLVKKHQRAGTYHLQAKIKAHNGLQPASSNKFTVKAS